MKKDYCTLWPDRAFGVDWSEACKTHDIDYENTIPRIQADKRLLNNVYKTVSIQSRAKLPKHAKWLAKPLGWMLANTMYLGVRIGGWYDYNKAKKKMR